MKPGQIAAVVVTFLSLACVVFAFLVNASPYVTIAEAREMKSMNVHLAGDIDQKSLVVNPDKGEVRFNVTDEKGETIPVFYKGSPPSNMGTATKVVAVGGVKNGEFVAHKMILKCPSKYESEGKPGAAS